MCSGYSFDNLVDARLRKFQQDYLQRKKPVRVNFRSLCSDWLWARRSEAYSHLMHRYPAKIFPYIPIFFLSSKTYASPNEIVLDPFAGTGTVLLESITHPYFKRHAIGVEINPLARLITKVKTTPIDTAKLTTVAKDLIAHVKTFSGRAEIPEFPNRNLWFSPHVQVELSKIRKCIEEIEDNDIKDFFLVCFSSIIREVSRADSRIATPVILRPENFTDPQEQKKVENLLKKKKYGKPLSCFKEKVEKNIRRLESLNKIDEIKSGKVTSEIVWDDARDLKSGRLVGKGRIDKTGARPIANESIGLVITSPPYINAQKYVRTTKFELFWLGMISEKELVGLDRRFIGTERIYFNEYKGLSYVGIASADNVIKHIYTKDPAKAGVVSKYFHDMRLVMREVHRVLEKGGRFILVIGDNTICGIKVKNHKILVDIAVQEVGFELEFVLVDKIRSRGMITKRHETGGLMLNDWIIVLKKEE